MCAAIYNNGIEHYNVAPTAQYIPHTVPQYTNVDPMRMSLIAGRLSNGVANIAASPTPIVSNNFAVPRPDVIPDNNINVTGPVRVKVCIVLFVNYLLNCLRLLF